MMRNLRQNDRGDDVRQLQQALASMGFNPGPIDGIFGPRTAAAVRNFQTAAGITVDGIVGPQTRGAMSNFGGGGAGGQQPPQQPQEPAFDPVESARQEREANRQAMRATVAWLPSQLVDVYIDEWVKSGQSELAWAVVRTSPTYDTYFAGNRRADGSLRMSEQDYMSHRDAFDRELRQWGLNPEMFQGRHVQLVEGEVSAQEFRQRIDAKATGVLQNLPEIRARFGEFYGISNLTDEALIAAALDPDIGMAVLQGRITAAQISGEAQRLGFARDRAASERLAQEGGLDQQRARDFYTLAGRTVPRMERFTERYETGRPGFGIEEFEEAGLFGQTELQRRMRRLHSSEMAMFRQGPVVSMDMGGAMTGLGRR